MLSKPSLLFVLFSLALFIPENGSATTTNSVCKNVATNFQKNLWDMTRQTADDLYCRKPWRERDPAEFAACGVASLSISFQNKVKNIWNRNLGENNQWAKWGPRALGIDWERGTIRGGFKRTFFTPALAGTDSEIEIVKRDGRARAEVTLCRFDQNGKVVESESRSFASGNQNLNSRKLFKWSSAQTSIIGVVVDTPPSVNKFAYKIQARSQPDKAFIGEVTGIADIHVHQFMNLAMGGRMYWGSVDGDLNQALREEVITGGIDPTKDKNSVEDVISSISQEGVDANVLLWTINKKPTDEGYFQFGGGYPDFKNWPHHADRSHQQAHISWVKEAHERNSDSGSSLNLMVVSLVINHVVCCAVIIVDPYGNVPRYDNNGEQTGWESANWGCSDHENILRQFDAIHALEKKYPWYQIAMNPWHARKIISEGGLAVVISLETDKPLSGQGGNYGDWKTQLDNYRSKGLSTLQIVHESDSKFAGAAPHRNLLEVLQFIRYPFTALRNLFENQSTFDVDINGHNKVGLKAEGAALIDAMVKRNMPIDLAHISVRGRRTIMNRVPKNYGLYDSHTKFERLLKPGHGKSFYGTNVLRREQEFLITESILPDYVNHKVLVGLRPTSIDVYDAPNSAVSNTCPGSSRSFAQLVQYAYDSGLPMAYGTDINTGVAQLGPRFGDDRCWASNSKLKEPTTRPVHPEGMLPKRSSRIGEIAGTNYYTDGVSNIGWLPELTEDLAILGTPGVERLRQSAEAFLQMWERAYTD